MFEQKNNNYNNKFINDVFSVAVHDLGPPVDQLVEVVPPKISRSGVEELVEPVFEVLFANEGNTAHLVRHGGEKMIIRWRKV